MRFRRLSRLSMLVGWSCVPSLPGEVSGSWGLWLDLWATALTPPSLGTASNALMSHVPLIEDLAVAIGLPVLETFAGKGAVQQRAWWQIGGIGLEGTPAANALAREADLVLTVGARLTDFATASHSLFANPAVRFASVNVNPRDADRLAPGSGEGKALDDAFLRDGRRRRGGLGDDAGPGDGRRVVGQAELDGDQVGDFRYYCELHGSPGGEGMAGTIKVVAADAPDGLAHAAAH